MTGLAVATIGAWLTEFSADPWNVKRWPPAAPYFAIKRCRIAENPRAVYGFPFVFLIK